MIEATGSSQMFKTETMRQSLHPVWNESFQVRVIACPPRAMHCPVDPVPCSRKLALYPVSERELVGRWCAVEDLVNSAANDDSEDLVCC